MAIVVTLNPELEALLRDKAARQGQDVGLVASELLAHVLEWEKQDSEEATKGIQQGLDDLEAVDFALSKSLLMNNAVSITCQPIHEVSYRNFKCRRSRSR